jgi:hypothetical protein
VGLSAANFFRKIGISTVVVSTITPPNAREAGFMFIVGNPCKLDDDDKYLQRNNGCPLLERRLISKLLISRKQL